MDTKQLKRIADAIEEILRLVKKDMEPKKKQKGDLLIPDPYYQWAKAYTTGL